MTERERLTERQREVLDFIQAKIQRDGYPPTIREIGDQLGIRSTNGVNDHLKALAKKGYLQRTEAKSRACVPTTEPDQDHGGGGVSPMSPGQRSPAGRAGATASIHTLRRGAQADLARRFAGQGLQAAGARGGQGLPQVSSQAVSKTRSIGGAGLHDKRGSSRSGLGDVEFLDLAHNDTEEVDVPVLGKIAAGQPILALESQEDSVRIDRMFLGKNRDRDVFALRVVGESMIEDGINDGDFIFVRKQRQAPRGAIVVALIDDEATVKRYYPEGDRIRFQPSNSAMQPIYVAASEFRDTQILGVVVGIYRRMD